MGLLVGSFGAPLPFYFIFSLVWVRWIVKRATRICHPQPDKPKAIKSRVKFIRGLEFNVPPTTAQSTVTVGPCWFGLESHEIKHRHTQSDNGFTNKRHTIPFWNREMKKKDTITVRKESKCLYAQRSHTTISTNFVHALTYSCVMPLICSGHLLFLLVSFVIPT